jgi:glutathione S-transferase
MLNIYGSPRSSSGRCFWCLEEVGEKYDYKPLNFKEKEHKSPEYLKINPNGKAPTLTDGDFVIWESIAINFYLAETYKPELLGLDNKQHGLVHQWSFWGIAELQPPIISTFIQLVFVPKERRNNGVIEKAAAKIPELLKVLDDALENKNYLVGDNFTLADLNVASITSVCSEIKFDLTAYKNIQTWLTRISERPAFKKYQKLC